MKKTLIAVILFLPVPGYSQAIEAAYQLTQTKPVLLKNTGNTNDSIPAIQKVFFHHRYYTEAFPGTYNSFLIKGKKTATIEYKNLEIDFLKNQKVQTVNLLNDTIYCFMIVPAPNRLYYYGKESVETEKDRKAIITLTETYNRAMAYKHTDSLVESRLLYILNRTVGTQQHIREGCLDVSWHTWKIEKRELIAEVFGIQEDYEYKCTFASSRITIPLDAISHFSISTPKNRIQVNMKENKFIYFRKMNKIKGDCDKEKWYGGEDEEKANAIELVPEWNIGHTGLTIEDLNNWLNKYQKQ